MAGFATFSDPLTASTQNTGLWGGNFGTLAWTGGGFLITNPINYTGYGGQSSNSAYDLTGASVFVNIANVGSQVLVSCESVPLEVNFSSSANRLFFYVNGGNISCFKTIAGAQTQVGSSATYNSTTHKWLRIRESGGTIFFDRSTDGKTWTNMTSVANPFAVTALFVATSLGTYANEASSTTMKITSYSTAPVSKSNPFFLLAP